MAVVERLDILAAARAEIGQRLGWPIHGGGAATWR